MKNKSKLLAVILVLTFLISLMSGCRLAIKDSKESMLTNSHDKLCGAFVTLGSSDNYDSNGKHEGIVNEDGSSQFSGLKGYYIGQNHITAPNGEDSICMVADKVLQDVKYDVFIDNNMKTNSFEATLYLNQTFNKAFNLYMVYQTPDKSYYCVKTTPGMQMENNNLSKSAQGSLSFKSQTDTTINKRKTGSKSEFKVNFKFTDETERAVIKEMNSKDQLIKTSELNKDAPEVFITQSNTSYVIVEETVKNSHGDHQIKRSIYSIDNIKSEASPITHNLYYPSSDGILIAKTIEFHHK
jgi:hypothetical protein